MRVTAYDITGSKTADFEAKIELLPSGEYWAIDPDTYDCDCDENGFYCISPQGYGTTPVLAVSDLLENMLTRAENAVHRLT